MRIRDRDQQYTYLKSLNKTERNCELGDQRTRDTYQKAPSLNLKFEPITKTQNIS